MRKSSLGLIAIALIYLGALWLWGLPINEMPFGDVDSAGHFVLGDYMSYSDKSMYNLPFFIVPMYGSENNGRIWYPPQYHTNEAIFQAIGGERIIPVYLWVLIASVLSVISVFFVINKLYGMLPAALASFLMVFSARNYMTYLWAQWPQVAAFAFVPIVIYCYYQYTKDNKKTIYLYMTSVFLAIQYFFHPQAVGHSAMAIIVYSVVFLIVNRKMPFKIKTGLIAFFLLIILMLPFFHFSINSILWQTQSVDYKAPITRLFSWYPSYDLFKGFIPEDYFSFSKMHGLWTLPFLLLGVLFLALRRKSNDLLLLSWLFSYYLLIHMDITGLMVGRLHRAMFDEAHIFYPIIALGLLSLPQLFTLKGKAKTYAKYALIILFLVLAVNFNARQAYSNLSSAYPGILRLNEAEYEAATWLRDLPEDKGVRIAGTLVAAKKKWIGFLAYKVPIYDYETLSGEKSPDINYTNYFFVDYTDALAIGRQDVAAAIAEWEKSMLENKTPLYNKNNIRVYETG